jgi:hypothetical protein
MHIAGSQGHAYGSYRFRLTSMDCPELCVLYRRTQYDYHRRQISFSSVC